MGNLTEPLKAGSQAGRGAPHPWGCSFSPSSLPCPAPEQRSPELLSAQQQNRTKNNLLVLMGLVLSLPRTFQPGSRDCSGPGLGEGRGC